MCLKIRIECTFLTIFLAFSYFSHGQFLHTPEEMEEIVMNTPEKYMIQETDNLGPEAFANCRKAGTPSHLVESETAQYSLSPKKLNKSERKKIKKRNKKILKSNSKSTEPINVDELVKNYLTLQDFDNALFYFLQLDNANAFTFENEYFLAKAYHETNRPEQAWQHIFNAKILSPYSEVRYEADEMKILDKLLEEILLSKKLVYQDWGLQFSYCIANRENKTFISFKSQPWRTYAICKSVWQEDEQHKSKMSTISDQSSWMIEEKECLLNALVSYLRHEENNPEYQGLQELANALDNNYVKEFIQYEAYVARNLPTPEGQPDRNMIERLKSYFLRVHTIASK